MPRLPAERVVRSAVVPVSCLRRPPGALQRGQRGESAVCGGAGIFSVYRRARRSVGSGETAQSAVVPISCLRRPAGSGNRLRQACC